MNPNITLSDFFYSYLSYAKYCVRSFSRYRRTYSNYFKVLSNIIFRKYPIQANLRTGGSIVLSNHMETFFLSMFQVQNKVTYDLKHDTVTINAERDFGLKPMKISFEGGVKNGDILATFIEDEYKLLPVYGNIVIDIGANIGDTAIYFALKGALRIIAIEPFPLNYKLAEKNISNSGFSNKIELVLAACSESKGEVLIDPDFKSSIVSLATSSTRGSAIPTLTLADLVDRAGNGSDLVLKMDCEGCEYNSVLSSRTEVLRKFKYLQIEYHRGYLDLKSKLERSNFKVTTSRPMANYRRQVMGYLYAERY